MAEIVALFNNQNLITSLKMSMVIDFRTITAV